LYLAIEFSCKNIVSKTRYLEQVCVLKTNHYWSSIFLTGNVRYNVDAPCNYFDGNLTKIRHWIWLHVQAVTWVWMQPEPTGQRRPVGRDLGHSCWSGGQSSTATATSAQVNTRQVGGYSRDLGHSC
jgi:hypothetical protein